MAIATFALTSCSNKWIILDSTNKYLPVLKRDGTLTRTKVRLAEDLRIEATTQDTLTSKANKGTTTITKTTLVGVTIEKNTKGVIVEENGTYYFVPDDKDLRKYNIPLNVDKETVFIRTENGVSGRNGVMVGTRFKVDSNSPGFEFKIKEKERKESIAKN